MGQAQLNKFGEMLNTYVSTKVENLREWVHQMGDRNEREDSPRHTPPVNDIEDTEVSTEVRTRSMTNDAIRIVGKANAASSRPAWCLFFSPILFIPTLTYHNTALFL